MRRLATVVCVGFALAASGCAGRTGRAPERSAPDFSDLHYSAVSPHDSAHAAADAMPGAVRGPARSSADGSSRGSPAFGTFVRAHEPQLQFCYREARVKSPTLTGSATVTVALERDGRVRTADVVRRSWSGRGSDVVESCMLERVRGWRFPPLGEKDEHVHSFAVIFSR